VSRIIPALRHAAVPVAYALVALVLLGPEIVSKCGDTLFGGAGDSTAGLIWLEWNYDVLGSSPFRSTTPLLNAPSGAPLWQPFYVTALVLMLPMWVFNKVVGPVCSWNVAVLLGFVLDGWVMFLFVRWLTRRTPVALLAGLAFLLLPYHYQKASGHLAYVHTWVFVAILWSALRVAARPSARRGAVLGLAVVVACYVDGYYLMIATSFGGTAAALVVLTAARDRAELVARARAVAVAGAVLAVLAIPILVSLMTSSRTISAAVERSSSDVAVYSARPWEYVLPARHHPLLPDDLAAWQDRHLHESNYSEQTLYLGTLPILGSLACIALAIRRRNGSGATPDIDSRPVPLGTTTLIIGGSALAALLLSAPPRVAAAGPSIVMPSGLISEVLPFWRVYARFFIPVAVCAITLAASALAASSKRGIVAFALVPLVVLDFLPPRPPAQFSYAEDTPSEYRWLDDQPPGQIVAEYPLDPPPLPNHITYLSYQRTHQQRLLNGAPFGTDDAQLRSGLAGLADPQTVPALASLGVRYVLVHPSTFGHPVDEQTLPATLTKVFDGPTGQAYRVDPSAAGPAALAPAAGFHVTDTTDFTSSRWMRTRGTLELRTFGPPRDLVVSFRAISFGTPRRLEIRQAGTSVWTGEIPADVTREVTFPIAGRGSLQLVASPRAVPIERLLPDTNDERDVTVNLAQLDVRVPER
jgi:hypothetical protein